MQEEIKKMKEWCLDNYSQGADVMVECWSDSDYMNLFEDIDGAQLSVAQAWDTLKSVAAVYADRQADARNSQF